MSCKGHMMVKTQEFKDPRGNHLTVVSRFGRVRAIHMTPDIDGALDICLTGRELLFWVKGLHE